MSMINVILGKGKSKGKKNIVLYLLVIEYSNSTVIDG